MADESAGGETNESQGENDALLSRLRLIEDQPLESRADAYSQIHDQLRSTLEGGDAPHAGA
jgi:hypothetical protein